MKKQKKYTTCELEQIALNLRKDILLMLQQAGSGHTGGSLSMVEILTVLYYVVMNHDPKNPKLKERDRFLLSKGHGCPALYAVLSNTGYFPPEELLTLRQLGSRLQGHPQLGLPGVEIASGSLGQGLSIACGMALAAKMDKEQHTIYCLMGDGETNEGQVWEAAMTASHYKLDNICAIIDYNKYQIDGKVCDIMGIEPLGNKWKEFGWHVEDTDGHDISALIKKFENVKKIKNRPSVIIAHTVKGKGVSFVESSNKWHGVAPSKDELEQALKELDLGFFKNKKTKK